MCDISNGKPGDVYMCAYVAAFLPAHVAVRNLSGMLWSRIQASDGEHANEALFKGISYAEEGN